eukprot:gene22841-biopygen17766
MLLYDRVHRSLFVLCLVRSAEHRNRSRKTLVGTRNGGSLHRLFGVCKKKTGDTAHTAETGIPGSRKNRFAAGTLTETQRTSRPSGPPPTQELRIPRAAIAFHLLRCTAVLERGCGGAPPLLSPPGHPAVGDSPARWTCVAEGIMSSGPPPPVRSRCVLPWPRPRVRGAEQRGAGACTLPDATSPPPQTLPQVGGAIVSTEEWTPSKNSGLRQRQTGKPLA